MKDTVAPADRGLSAYRALAVATGEGHTCALLDDQNVKCWGVASYGQLGYGDTRSRGGAPTDMGDALPTVDLGTGRTARTIAAGRNVTCAILDDGSLKCWGWAQLNGRLTTGNIGDSPGEMGDRLAPLDFGGRKAVHVAVGHYDACASMDDETIWCWGEQVTAMTPQMLQPGALPAKKVRTLFASESGIGVLFDDGTVTSVLIGGHLDTLTSGHKALAVAGAAGESTCAILDDGTTACMDGTVLRQLDVPGHATALGVEAFGSLCALLSGGTVQCFGQGCGGTATPPPYWCPSGEATIALGQPAVAVSSGGEDSACALLADGGIKCWGGDPTMPPGEWLGAEIVLTRADGGLSAGVWRPIDLGTHR